MIGWGLNPAMAWDRLEPPQRAGDVARRTPLVVRPLRRRSVDELLVVDDDLPQADGATLFWLARDGARWVAWAALLRDAEAIPWIVSAPAVRLVRPDPALLRLLGADAAGVGVEGDPRPVEPMPRQLSCICRETSAESVYRAAEAGWTSVDAVKRRAGAVFGECQGRRCESRIAGWLDLVEDQFQAHITPRPPLVPVPASVLAAFADA